MNIIDLMISIEMPYEEIRYYQFIISFIYFVSMH